jgi:thymidylate synthase (FAD)
MYPTFVTEPRAYIIARPAIEWDNFSRFLADEQVEFISDSNSEAEKLVKVGGQLCYRSFGKGRKTDADYLRHILECGHGSVLEHANWTILITDVSRTLTHELVRHRAGMAYSQESQRYVAASDVSFVIPAAIYAAGEAALALHKTHCMAAQVSYEQLCKALEPSHAHITDPTERRKATRQAARAVLPGCTVTSIQVTGNARAWRNFLEQRGSNHAEPEIRALAMVLLPLLQAEAPVLFGDFSQQETNGVTWIASQYRKV